MDEFVELAKSFVVRYQPWELIVLVAVVAAAFALWRGLHFWHTVRVAQAKVSLQQELLRRGLSVEEAAPLFRLAFEGQTLESDETLGNIFRTLGHLKSSPAELEEQTGLLRRADGRTRQAISDALDGLFSARGIEPSKEQAFAVIRGFCGTATVGPAHAAIQS